jgi:dipeptidyl aminopeptidase/acylaminoacyl peptidase
MKHMLRVAGTLLVASTLFAQRQPFDVTALLKIARIGDPRVAPDGKLVAFTVQSIDLDENKKPTAIWVAPVKGGTPRQIAHQGSVNERPRWSPDSKRIAFVSNRSGTSQVWLMDADGGNPKQVTNLSTEADGVLFAPDGKHLVFTSGVYPECHDEACNSRRLAEDKDAKVQARVYSALLYRHWTEWQTARRSHLFSVEVAGGKASDLTPGDRDVPPFSLGGPDNYAISPDSTEFCFAMNADPVPATSTNTDLFVVPLAGGEAKKITSNPAADASPQYSPNGRYLAWRSQSRPGYEADRWQLMVMERATGSAVSLTEPLDRSVDSFAWSPDSAYLFYTDVDRGRQHIHMIPATGGGSREVTSGNVSMDDMQFTPDGKTMIYTQQSGSSPAEIYRASSSGGPPVPLTHLNDPLLANYQLTPLEEHWVDAAEGARVHTFLVKPPDFHEDRKYPVLFLIHGGPQGEWGEQWSYRWNAQVFAAAGYLVVMPNPRGSFGYGQKFTDDINADWGGKAYDDIMAVVDYAAGLPYADSTRMGAAGASYGGYMIDWMLGHTDRFRVFVSHAGVFDLRSMAGATEELWFPMWEFQGMPWDNPDVYAKWSPSYFVKQFKTPTLVVAGELDFRVPYTQSLQLFTALQLQKAPSKLLVFPDEGHWVLKPRNSAFWYKSVLDWIGEWINKQPAN